MIWMDENQESFVIGATLPGLPYFMSGRSKKVAWGITILYSDAADFWEERVNENQT